jgi:hypothetical protein
MIPDISGDWLCDKKYIYKIVQVDKVFEWSTERHAAGKQVGLGFFQKNNSVRALWNYHNGKKGSIGMETGELKKKANKCIEIKWSGGECFRR